MRKKPRQKDTELNFINGGAISETEVTNKKQIPPPQSLGWPFFRKTYQPNMEEGSNLRKPLTLPLKEYEWNTLDKHITILGVSKTEWIRYAMNRLLNEEQKILNDLKYK